MMVNIDSTAFGYGFLCSGNVSLSNSTILGSIVGKDTTSRQLQTLFIQAEGLVLNNSEVNFQTISKSSCVYLGSNLLLNKSVWDMSTPETYNMTAIDVAEIALITNDSKVEIDIRSNNNCYALQTTLLRCEGSDIHCVLNGKQCMPIYAERTELNNALFHAEVVAHEMATGIQSDGICCTGTCHRHSRISQSASQTALRFRSLLLIPSASWIRSHCSRRRRSDPVRPARSIPQTRWQPRVLQGRKTEYCR